MPLPALTRIFLVALSNMADSSVSGRKRARAEITADSEVVEEAVSSKALLSPIATPLASAKLTKKLFKVIKKGAFGQPSSSSELTGVPRVCHRSFPACRLCVQLPARKS